MSSFMYETDTSVEIIAHKVRGVKVSGEAPAGKLGSLEAEI